MLFDEWLAVKRVEFGENVPLLKRGMYTRFGVQVKLGVQSKIQLWPYPTNTLTAIDSTRVCLEDYHIQILAEEAQMFYHSSAAPHSMSVSRAHYA